MAEDHRTPGAEVVDVAVAIGVGEPGTLGALNEGRFAAYGAKGANGRVDSAGEKALRTLLQGLGAGAGLGAHGVFSLAYELHYEQSAIARNGFYDL